MRWPGVATRGPSVASRGQGVCPGAIGRALGRALTKRTSDTLNVAGRLGGPDSVWNTSGRDFRAPVLGLHCRCPYGTTLEKVSWLAHLPDNKLDLWGHYMLLNQFFQVGGSYVHVAPD